MRIAVPKEIKDGEKRVALVPDIISKLTKAGLEVVIESGAGVTAQASDEDFKKAGASVEKTKRATFSLKKSCPLHIACRSLIISF
jgi:NAD(P) transhydrogenase subunit alpha